MIPLLPSWNLRPNRPSFYDTDSATILELASNLHETMNNLIDDYNDFVEATNEKLTEFAEHTAQSQESFAVGLRQEFQDFINIVELKITGMNNTLNTLLETQVPVAQKLINDAIRAGTLKVTETYNPATESLNLNVTGGV